jgi:hypothetical protein
MRGYSTILLLVMIAGLAVCSGTTIADELEHDRCSCKLVMKGADSTLKGGVCVRTEAATCLMEWGGGSTGKTAQGSGLSQREAGEKAQAEFKDAFDARAAIPRLVPTPESASPLEVAISNLSRVPPSGYAAPGMVESFVLAAGSALERYQRAPLTFLAVSLSRNRREQFIKLIQDGGEMTVEQFLIRGSAGCLVVLDKSQPLSVFVKTPFAISDRC